MEKSVLLVEDDENIKEVLKKNLETIGLLIDHASDGMTGLELARANSYDLIILDISLPRLGGIELCREIRKFNARVPILFLTARDEEISKVIGLELGADDYLTKPFSLPELKARIKALLRRAEIGAADDGEQEQTTGSALVLGDLTIDLEYRKVVRRGQSIELSAKEFDLLAFLAQTPGRPFRRNELLYSVWGLRSAAYESNVNTLITRLRQKLEDNPGEPKYIKTVWGVGYKFAELQELEE